MESYDIAIIGGGASGLAAAIEAAGTAAAAKIVLLEKKPRLGQKILATGNGRCNLSNLNITAADYNPEAAPLLQMVEDYADDARFFASLGLRLRADEAGRLYPCSNAAASVLDALRFAVGGLGVKAITDFQADDLRREGKILAVIAADGRKISARRVILAAGTPAGQKAAGQGILACPLLAAHRPKPLRPALAPVPVAADGIAAIKGLRARGRVTLLDGERPICSREGEVSFGAGYLSGICVMDVSGRAAGLKNGALALDLTPDMTMRELRRYLHSLPRIRAAFAAEDALTGLLNKRIALQLMQAAGVRAKNRRAGELTARELDAIAEKLKAWRFAITGTADFASAQVACGGIPAVDCGAGLQSRLIPGLHFCGEILDVTGYCGGYNLHWAWASGRCAGAAAALSLRG